MRSQLRNATGLGLLELALCTSALGCSSFAATADAADTATADASAADERVLAHDDFESSCNPWQSIRGSVTSSNKSCQATISEESGGGAQRTVRAASAAQGVAPGVYELSVDVSDSLNKAPINFEIYDVTPTFQRGTFLSSRQASLSPSLQTLRVTVSLSAHDGGENPTGLWIDLYTSGSGLKGTSFSFDNFKVERIKP